MALTDKQERFCQEHVVHQKDKSEAYRIAYDAENMSAEAINVNASKLAKNTKVALRISELKEKASEVLEITHQEVLRKLKMWVEYDITETINVTPEGLKELPLELRQLITSYKHTKKTYQVGDDPVTEDFIELKFVSKEKAIEMINKHIGFYEKDNEQKKPFDFSKLSDTAIQEMLNASK